MATPLTEKEELAGGQKLKTRRTMMLYCPRVGPAELPVPRCCCVARRPGARVPPLPHCSSRAGPASPALNLVGGVPGGYDI